MNTEEVKIAKSTKVNIELALRAIGIHAGRHEVRNGFYDATAPASNNRAEKIALMHSELSEALEALRDRQAREDCPLTNVQNFIDVPSEKIPDYSNLEEEFADTIIRIMAFAFHDELDISGAITAKLEYNDNRPYKHGREF